MQEKTLSSSQVNKYGFYLLTPVFRCSTRKFPAFLFSLFSFLLPPLDFSLIYNKFLMPFRGFFYWKNFFDTL